MGIGSGLNVMNGNEKIRTVPTCIVVMVFLWIMNGMW